jgi:tetratricopeptide (TPR) repeat protein
MPAASVGLPATTAGLPAVLGFGEIDLPSVTDALPAAFSNEKQLPARPSSAPSPLDAFGEIDLPREPPPGMASPVPPAPSQPPRPSGDFGELQLEEGPRAPGARGHAAVVRADDRPHSGEPANASSEAVGGASYGEVSFGGVEGGAAGEPIGIDAVHLPPAGAPPAPPDAGASLGEAPSLPPPSAAATAAVAAAAAHVPLRARAVEPARKRSSRGLIVAGLLGVAAVAGAALQLTSYGAFGYLYVGDRLHAADYDHATQLAMLEAERTLSADTYDAAKSAADGTLAAHARAARARSLTAYAALVDLATTVRFGPDAARGSRAKQLLDELSAKDPTKYQDVALAAQLAVDGDASGARKALDSVARTYAADPVRNEVWLLRGDVELAARDGAAARAAFQHALEAGNDARAHFGLARAYDLEGDASNARKEIEATLAASPQHPGALTLRAHTKSAVVDEALAMRDLAAVLEGPARAKASPTELSNAYTARAWVSLERGAASEAREAFAQAVKLDARNVDALGGEGRLFLNEGRYTEALSRFDTALAADPNSPDLIAGDADAMLGLERLADAKQKLLAAKQRFPKNVPLLMVLGRVEQHLGNNDAAETDLRTAIGLVDPSRHDAVVPYVALSELLSARGRLADAKATLDDAKKKLPASAALDRAFGEVAELQGDYDTAIADYRSSLAKDPRDVATHFHLAVALRRERKFDDAGSELDRVAAVDKDYPGLSLERGLLFEESGDVPKAIEQFKSALARAPDDPDLQLRVGSAYVAIGRPDDALPMLRKVLDKRPGSAEAHHYIGRALMLKGRGEQVEAVRYLKRAVDLDPNRAEFHVYLAWEANETTPAQLELARDEIDKALALDKMSAEAYWQKGVLERMEGAIEDAVRDTKRALELRPTRYEAHATLAQCYEDKNDPGDALVEWTRAIAGDGDVLTADGTVPHPFWRYRYGKLLLERGNLAGALAQIVPAAVASEKMDPRPGWLAPLEFLAGEVLRKSGKGADAIEHYKRFLEIAPVTSPDRADAQAALTQLGGGR